MYKVTYILSKTLFKNCIGPIHTFDILQNGPNNIKKPYRSQQEGFH